MQDASAARGTFHTRHSDHVVDWREHVRALPYAGGDAEGWAVYDQRVGHRWLYEGFLAGRTSHSPLATSRGLARQWGYYVCDCASALATLGIRVTSQRHRRYCHLELRLLAT